MSEVFGDKERKKELLKTMIRKLHAGAQPEEVKGDFKDALKGLEAADIAKIEEELIHEGMPRDEIQRLCEVHLAVFRETLEKEQTLAPVGHPIHTLMEEHKILLQYVEKLKTTLAVIQGLADQAALSKARTELSDLVEHFKDSEKHYLREENVLFPYLEKHGITGPPAVMWAEHNEIRATKKIIYDAIESNAHLNLHDFISRINEAAIRLGDQLMSHFYKENNILFPTAMKVITTDEWHAVEAQFLEVGYCCFTPESATRQTEKVSPAATETVAAMAINFETGSFALEELETILDTLPIDFTFVDKDDKVRYFNQAKDRIFTRTKAVLGRQVQLCHPKQSLHKVEEILNDFKSNKRDVAEFWINMQGKLVHIRYFAVRKNGEYLGTLEVTQDITALKQIEGEKRLL